MDWASATFGNKKQIHGVALLALTTLGRVGCHVKLITTATRMCWNEKFQKGGTFNPHESEQPHNHEGKLGPGFRFTINRDAKELAMEAPLF